MAEGWNLLGSPNLFILKFTRHLLDFASLFVQNIIIMFWIWYGFLSSSKYDPMKVEMKLFFWMSEYISFVHNVKFSYLFTIFFSYKYMFSWMIYSPNWFFYRRSRSIFHILKKHTNQTPKLLWGIICMKLAKQPKCMR